MTDRKEIEALAAMLRAQGCTVEFRLDADGSIAGVSTVGTHMGFQGHELDPLGFAERARQFKGRELSREYLRTIARSRAETQRHLDKALSYSPQFQKPEQVKYYRAFLVYLDELAAGKGGTGGTAVAPRSDRALWDVTQEVLDARAAQHRMDGYNARMHAYQGRLESLNTCPHRPESGMPYEEWVAGWNQADEELQCKGQ